MAVAGVENPHTETPRDESSSHSRSDARNEIQTGEWCTQDYTIEPYSDIMVRLKQIDTGGLQFRDIREDDKYYVDKSMLIADILGTNDRGVYLYTRPRRFGKSTNISMLDAFFNLRYPGNKWFDGLEISEHHEYDGYRNVFPVIHLDLKDALPRISDTDAVYYLQRVRSVLSNALAGFAYLLDSPSVSEPDRSRLRSILDGSVEEASLVDSLRVLCRMLEAHHGAKVVVLIDEYDHAVTRTFGRSVQKDVLDFLGSFMSSTLKSNPSLQFAYVTGVMQVAKAGIFSGLNNLSVNNVFSRMSDERFGFTEDEVRGILEYYGRSDKIGEAREWYDGYRFGEAEVYNPFSIMSYASSGFVPENYWANTSSDTSVRWALDRVDADGAETLLNILAGESPECRLSPSLSFEELNYTDARGLFSLMVMAGDLKAVPLGDDNYSLSLPNNEVRDAVNTLLSVSRRQKDPGFARFNNALLEGDAETMAEVLQQILLSGSYMNLTHPVYQAVLYTIMQAIAGFYSVETEDDEGNGRSDIVLKPRRKGDTPIIIEIKTSKTEEGLDREVGEALRQIHSRRYYLGMSGKVILVGMAFWGKVPRVATEIIIV